MSPARIFILALLWTLPYIPGCSNGSDDGASSESGAAEGSSDGDTASTEGRNDSPGTGLGDNASRAASTDGEAGEGIAEGGDAFECATDEDCSTADAICSCHGECVDVVDKNPCTEPKNCGSGTWCDPCTRHCEVRGELCDVCSNAGLCDDQGQCRSLDDGSCDGGVCVEFASGGSFCGIDCLNDNRCSAGYHCVEVDGASWSQCVPIAGTCTDLGECDVDADCPEGEVCNAMMKVCAAGCTEDAECGGDFVCVQARCVMPCQSDEECEGEAVCEDNGHCRIPGSCTTWTECEPQHYCHKTEGECVPGCQLDDQCYDAAMECENGTCVPKGCAHHYQCSFEEECDASKGECIPMTKPHCSECTADAQDPTQCEGAPNLCLAFQDAEGTAMGDYCVLTCEDDSIDKCPQGYGCEQIEDPQAGIDGWYCVRSCWTNPVGSAAP